jgi:phospholipase/carboxylesterase
MSAAPRITRRRFGGLVGATLGSLVVGDACGAVGWSPLDSSGRIAVRPAAGTTTTAEGSKRLGLDTGRDALLQVPADVKGPLPLLVLLHGAGGSGARMLQRIAPAVDAAKIAVLAPDSREPTWDAISGDFGEDVQFLNRALERVFATVAVDPARVTLGGFSDGATYALSLGLINGDVFPRVIAFSPGFVVRGDTHGQPRFFISHGTSDPILPIDGASRQIVPALRDRGYEVTYREFDGKHEVPPAIATEAMTWATQK